MTSLNWLTLAYANRVSSFAISLGSMAVLGRLLPPSQFGLVSMATIAIGFLSIFREFGLSAAAIQTPTFSHTDRNALFWFSLLFASVITGVILISAPIVAAFYREPRVELLLRLAAVGFFISGLSIQHNALLRRSLSFGSIFVADVGGIFLGAIFSIGLAAYTGDALSIIVGGIAQAVFTTFATIWLGGWLPRLPANLRTHLRYVAFGANVSVFTFLNFLTNNIASIVLGRLGDAATLGLFYRAQNLYALPSNFILGPYLQVQFPLLCRAADRSAETRQLYSDLLLLTGITFVPAGCVLPFIAVDLTSVILGHQWTEAGGILAWFAPAMVALGLTAPFGQYMTSQGRVRELSFWGLGDLTIRGGGAALGAMFGAQQAAAGFSLATLVLATPILIWLTVRRGPFRVRDYFEAAYPGVLIGTTTLLLALLTKTIIHSESLSSVLVILLSGTIWISLILTLGPTRLLLRRITSKEKNDIKSEK